MTNPLLIVLDVLHFPVYLGNQFVKEYIFYSFYRWVLDEGEKVVKTLDFVKKNL